MHKLCGTQNVPQWVRTCKNVCLFCVAAQYVVDVATLLTLLNFQRDVCVLD
jgi:hypothetical protein